MAINETILLTNTLPFDAVKTLISIIAALGGIVFIYIVFSVLNFILNKKKQKTIENMNKKLEEIVDLLKKDKKK